MQPNPKDTVSGRKARERALRGVEKVYEAVSATLGPRSNNVAIARPYGRPAVVHDGVTVAKEVIPLKDPVENVGAELAVEAASRTNQVGDGTTTATVLMYAIAKEANTQIAANAKPMALRAGIEDAVTIVAEALSKAAIEVKENDQIRRIATVSAQDERLGNMVATAYDKLGLEAILSVEESSGSESYMDIKTGFEFDRGWRSPFFITDTALEEADIPDAYVLVTDHSFSSVADIGPVLARLGEEGVRNIVVIASDIDGEALAFMAVNKIKGNLKALAIQAPSFGERRTEMLRDIAIFTGATFITQAAGMTLDGVTKATLGHAGRIKSTRNTTLIIEGGGSKEELQKRADDLKVRADNPDINDFDREKLMERYAKFVSGVAVLTIGAKSESELKEQKERAIDAVSAAKAAIDGGIVPGGGTALLDAAKALDKFEIPEVWRNDRDYGNGIDIVANACRAPFRKLLRNAGFDPGSYIKEVGNGKGFDVTTGKIVDLLEQGIIDPVLVVRGALENASSNAVMLATTDVIIVEQPRDDK